MRSALVDAAARYVERAKSERTRRAYQRDWARFAAWCAAEDLAALPAAPRTVALYLVASAEAGRRVSSITRSLAAISEAHRFAGHDSPRGTAPVREVMKGIRRTHGSAPRRVEALLVDDLRRLVAAQPPTLRGIRDRALLLVGFAGAFRRSELVALDVEDLRFTGDGCEVTVRRSKTDQEGAGRKVGLPYGSDVATCPVRSARAWLDQAGFTSGPLFRPVDKVGRIRAPRSRDLDAPRLSDRAVANIVKRAAAAAGLGPVAYSGHSLRSGLCTSAARAGKTERAIMAQSGHRTTTSLRLYIRDGGLFLDNAAAGIGL